MIRNNESGIGGGGVLIDGGAPIIRNCVITANDAPYGGGIYMQNEAEPVIQNCTLSGNTLYWGQFWSISGANPILRNLIIDDSMDYAAVFYDITSLPQEMSNCLLHDAPTALVYILGAMTQNNLAQLNAQTWAGGNLEGDPAFVNRAAGNFHLTSASPALDTGLATGAPTTDRDGATRPYDVPSVGQAGADAFDIGAYEYQGSAAVTEWELY
jgi:parallel beta-helix repeat protein